MSSSYVLLEAGAGQVIEGRARRSRLGNGDLLCDHGAIIDVRDPEGVWIGGKPFVHPTYGRYYGDHPVGGPGRYRVVVSQYGSIDRPSIVSLVKVHFTAPIDRGGDQ